MSFEWMDAVEQADRIRKKEINPEELIKATINRIENINPAINAVTAEMFEEALAAAGKGDVTGPFAGVPFLMKDLEFFGETSYTAGSRYLKDFTAPGDSDYAARIRESGLITVGKTNTCEFGLLPTTEPAAYGATRNPWDLAHTAGGSSGGSAAAVAAGIVPMAHASDGGGSIRIPASCTGLFGLKPSRGRNPRNPDTVGLAVNHCVSRSVRDSAALLDATRGSAPGGPFSAPPPERSYASEVNREPGNLKIAFLTTGFDGKKIHPDCEASVLDTVKLCSGLGHEVEEAGPSIHVEKFNKAFSVLWQTSLAQGLTSLSRMLGRAPEEHELEPYTWEVYKRGSEIKGTEYLFALGYMQQTARMMARFFSDYDLLLTPTLAEPPLQIGELAYQGNPDEYVDRLNGWVPYTPLANTTGIPAMSVPLFQNSEGLPIGVHFMAPFGDEATLFRLAGQLEKAKPWKDTYPSID
ncbi:amidase [Bacillus marinisedimentorum]|uniref:amidase n=1 Tax=Bacillus marinisedimentorum TaxID=1821260 RepID=UPI0008726663|nr:amidase family protein [Bacillus marinisedimentorum]